MFYIIPKNAFFLFFGILREFTLCLSVDFIEHVPTICLLDALYPDLPVYELYQLFRVLPLSGRSAEMRTTLTCLDAIPSCQAIASLRVDTL